MTLFSSVSIVDFEQVNASLVTAKSTWIFVFSGVCIIMKCKRTKLKAMLFFYLTKWQVAISRALIGQHLIFCPPTWSTCCISPRKFTRQGDARQNAGLPIVTYTTSWGLNWGKIYILYKGIKTLRKEIVSCHTKGTSYCYTSLYHKGDLSSIINIFAKET